jgi:uncharacterized membrane protein YidH (DUF202 family)
MLYSSFCFAVFFSIGYLCNRYVFYKEERQYALYRPPFWDNLQYITGVGILDAVNGFIIIYSSLPDRTPPVLQPVLGNTAIIWSILLSKYHVSNLRKRSYCNMWVMMAILLVTSGVALMVTPVIVDHGLDSIVGISQAGWIFVFICGVIPGAWYNVMQQRTLDHMTRKRMESGILDSTDFGEDYTTAKSSRLPLVAEQLTVKLEKYYQQLDIWFVLSVSCIIQLGFVFVFFWINFVPWFGFGDKLHLSETIKCYLGMFPECDKTWWIGLIFLSSYLVTYFTSIVINETSANYNEFVGSLIAPLSVAFWYIFPDVVDTPVDPPPLWAAISALVLLTIATFIWRWWEKTQEKKEEIEETETAGGVDIRSH